MSDEFDRFLASSLAPPERLPDRRFVATVQARIIVEERLARERRTLVGNLIRQLVALGAVAAALLWIGRTPAIGAIVADSPGFAVLVLVIGFSLLIALLTGKAVTDSVSGRYFRDLTN